MLATIATAVLALLGVLLGALLSDRSQRRSLTHADRMAERRAREDAYIGYLSAYRQFRRFVQQESADVEIKEFGDGSLGVPVIGGGSDYWTRVEDALARLELLKPSAQVHEAAEAIRSAFWDFARARAALGHSRLPTDDLVTLRQAEQDFIRAVQEELANNRGINSKGTPP